VGGFAQVFEKGSRGLGLASSLEISAFPSYPPGGLLFSVTGFVCEHPFFGAAAPFAFLPSNLFHSGLLRRHPAGLQLFNFVQQQPPGNESVEPLLTRCLALDLQAGGAVEQHDAGGRFVDILTPMSSRSHKSLFNIRLAHAQGGHSLGELLCLFWIHGKRSHGRNLAEHAANLKGPALLPIGLPKARCRDIVARVNRRDFLKTGLAGSSAAWAISTTAASASTDPASQSFSHSRSFEWEETTVSQLHSAMLAGRISSAAITRQYLSRIRDLDRRGPKLNAIIELNPDAVPIAESLDRERKIRGPRGPLHGIPVLIKDNIATHDKMMTTAGSLALAGSMPPADAFLIQRLRAAGAVILGKTNLSEWANFRSTHSTSGWSGRGGLTLNPYVLDRNPSGSSSGSGAAASANLCAVAVGTETDGSITSPASYNGLVGIKPTLGLVSRFGIVPIAHSQDTAGPMTRTVADAAIVLGCLAGVDANDPATAAAAGKIAPDYTAFLNAAALRGARIGVARKYFGIMDAVDKLMEDAIAVMKTHGALISDPADLPSHEKLGGENEDEVLLHEFKADLNKYLAWLGPSAAVRSLAEIIDFNERNKTREMPWFGQELFLKAQAKGPLTEKVYIEALAQNHRLSRDEGIDAVMDRLKLDAIIAPTSGPAQRTDLLWGDRDTGGCTTPAALAGYPHITVPVGLVDGLPVGISFFGRAWSEPGLLGLAFAFEQIKKARKAPRFLATLPG
jgi:amidase